jgi:GNAT superfamily N-acetyltransferase
VPAAFYLREMRSHDSEALARLVAQSPDGGRITFSPRYHLPLYDLYTARGSDAVVAEVEGIPGLVGAARVSYGECQFEDQVYPYALLSSLTVHPEHRRKGIASALAQWRIEKAVERGGSDTVILADIQSGNVGSTANAKKWANQIGGQVVNSPIPMRSKPPKSVNGITVREANEKELEGIAQQLNTFYHGYNFYRPQTAKTLHHWLHDSMLDTPVNHYRVAVDSSNRLLAGLGLREAGRLMTLYVEKLPRMIRIANIFLKVVPSDGEMRNLEADKLWFAPGQLEAARYLWQTSRWEWRERGTGLLLSYDPRSPIAQILQNPAWMPTTSVSLAVRAPVPMSASRLLYPLI